MSTRRAVMWLALLTLALVLLTAAVDLLGVAAHLTPPTPIRGTEPPLSDTPTLTASAERALPAAVVRIAPALHPSPL